MPKNYLSKYLSESDLNEIGNVISDVENHTSGEIRLCIKVRRDILENRLSVRELAMNEFYSLKMDETRDKTGVLIFILFEERKFEIIADEGINSKIQDFVWNNLINESVSYFRNEKYKDGIIFIIREIGKILTSEFPRRGDDKNELSDDVIVN